MTLALVVGAHGIAGEVRLRIFADDLSAFARLQAGDRSLTLKAVRPGANGAVARFAEIGDRNAAEALRGTELTVSRSALPPLGEGEYYHADLIGLPARATSGEALGTVIAVENYGAGDVIEVRRPDGRTFMVPMNAHAVPDWGEHLLIDPAFIA